MNLNPPSNEAGFFVGSWPDLQEKACILVWCLQQKRMSFPRRGDKDDKKFMRNINMTFHLNPLDLILYLQSFPAEVSALLTFLLCATSILVAVRYFGSLGLFTYAVVALVVANIQVLKITPFTFYNDTIALGTIVFSSIFLCHDILTDHFGAIVAKKSVRIGFFTLLFFTIAMVLTMGFPVAQPDGAQEVQSALQKLFVPVPALFVASLTSYIISQYNDIWIFDRLKGTTGSKLLWLRSLVSTGIASLLDSIIFSVLAWVVFASDPMDWHTLVYTYILGTYVLRLGIAVLNIPVLYAAKRLMQAHVYN